MEQTRQHALQFGLFGILLFFCLSSLHTILSTLSHFLLFIPAVSVIAVVSVKSILTLLFTALNVGILARLIQTYRSRASLRPAMYISTVVLFPILSIIRYIITFGTSLSLARNIAVEMFASLTMYSSILDLILQSVNIVVFTLAGIIIGVMAVKQAE